ncbi:hypothetical protein CF54_17150 [Streptomyces sp. Tu 6176]|nr:hypothetical protein CF54_17150 [Streptomyces sp. Tu 6176]
MHVLDNEDLGAQPVQEFGERAEQAVPCGSGVMEGLRRRGQRVGPLREQRTQRPGQRGELQTGRSGTGLAYRVHHRAEGQRLLERRAHRHQRAARPYGGGAEGLLEQPALAHSGLALDQHRRGAAAQRADDLFQFGAAADQARNTHRDGVRCVVCRRLLHWSPSCVGKGRWSTSVTCSHLEVPETCLAVHLSCPVP